VVALDVGALLDPNVPVAALSGVVVSAPISDMAVALILFVEAAPVTTTFAVPFR